MLEIIYFIAKTKGVSIEELESIRSEKAEKRGGFDNTILLKEVSEG